MLHNLMERCEAAAKERGVADVQDATLHSSGKMIESTYDRRRVRVARTAK